MVYGAKKSSNLEKKSIMIALSLPQQPEGATKHIQLVVFAKPLNQCSDRPASAVKILF